MQNFRIDTKLPQVCHLTPLQSLFLPLISEKILTDLKVGSSEWPFFSGQTVLQEQLKISSFLY